MEYARYFTIIASLVGGVWIASRVYKAPKKMIFSHGQHHLGQPFIIDFLDPSFDKSVPCTGPNKGYKAIPGFGICGIELDEWIMVDALVTPKHSVIEFGARFGTTSCRLARATRNSGARQRGATLPDPDARGEQMQLPCGVWYHQRSQAILAAWLKWVQYPNHRCRQSSQS